MISLKGKVVFITGANRGIGHANAKLFAREKARLALTYCTDEKGGKETKRECRSLGAKDIFLLKLDVRNNRNIISTVRQVINRFGKIDILINNAGVIAWKRLPEQNFEEIETQLRTNLEGVIKVTKVCLPNVTQMIINMASAASLAGYPDMIAYCASKWGVRGFTQSLAKECPRIKVHDVISGGVATRMKNFKGLPPETVARVIVDFAKEKHSLPSGADINVRNYAPKH